MKRRWRKQHLSQPAEVNITAFMNLMVILVPFLLITAVFTRITVLDLDLPAQASADNQQPPQEPELQLEVVVRQDVIEVGDRKRGLLQRIEVSEDGSDLQAVSEVLRQVKARHPDIRDVTLLLETDIAYERLVAMMDTLRVTPVEQGGETQLAELFPQISIGDAPPPAAGKGKRSS